MNYQKANINQQNYMENNFHQQHEEDNYHGQQINNSNNLNVNNNQVYTYRAQNNNEINSKYIEDDYINRNYDNNFVNQSVKNIFPVQDKEADEHNKDRGCDRSVDNYYQIGAYEKSNNKDHSYMGMGDSFNKENRNSFAYDSKISNKNLQPKNNEVRYLQGNNAIHKLISQ